MVSPHLSSPGPSRLWLLPLLITFRPARSSAATSSLTRCSHRSSAAIAARIRAGVSLGSRWIDSSLPTSCPHSSPTWPGRPSDAIPVRSLLTPGAGPDACPWSRKAALLFLSRQDDVAPAPVHLQHDPPGLALQRRGLRLERVPLCLPTTQPLPEGSPSAKTEPSSGPAQTDDRLGG